MDEEEPTETSSGEAPNYANDTGSTPDDNLEEKEQLAANATVEPAVDSETLRGPGESAHDCETGRLRQFKSPSPQTDDEIEDEVDSAIDWQKLPGVLATLNLMSVEFGASREWLLICRREFDFIVERDNQENQDPCLALTLLLNKQTYLAIRKVYSCTLSR